MKKIKLFTAVMLLFGIGLLAACKKEKLATYNVAANSIYYNYISQQLQPLDTIGFTFAFSPASVTDSVYKIPVAVTGQASTKDRVYNVTIDTGTTAVAGTDYTLPSTFIFHANRLKDSLPVTIKRTVAMQTKPVTLRLTLKSSADLNANFKTTKTQFGDTIKVNTFKLNISDILTQGTYWSSFSAYLGVFSVKKVQLVNQVTGMPLNYITIIGLEDLNFPARMSYYAITMANYLAAQKAAGHTVYEADGVTPMTMGAAYQ